MKYQPLTIYLMIAGLTMLLVGAFIALAPNHYVAALNTNPILYSSHEAISESTVSVDMLSDLRGMGGMLLFVGVFTIFSAFKPTLRNSALITSTLVCSAYAAMRSIGFLFDGMPSNAILIAYGIEITFALLGMTLLMKRNAIPKQHLSFCSDLANS